MISSHLIVILALGGLTGSQGQANPGPSFQCFSISLLGCNWDCMHEHGAISGECNLNNACCCHYEGDNMAPLASDTTPSPPAAENDEFPLQQCQTNKNAIVATAYELVCAIDCSCSHGASGGTCNFTSTTCHCNYDTDATYADTDLTNCPYCSQDAAFTALNSLMIQLNQILAKLNLPIPILPLLDILPIPLAPGIC